MSLWYSHILDAFKVPSHRRCASHWSARCPCHDDNEPSLAIWLGRDGDRLLIGCWAGCEKLDVLHAAGLSMRDLFRPKTDANGDAVPFRAKVIEAAYDYLDESGELLFQTVRYRDPKNFRQRRPDPSGDGWLWDLSDVRLVLYRTPEIARHRSAVIYLAEGEKCADALHAAGLLATTGAGGCGMGWRDEYALQLAGRRVVLLPDNDAPGRQLMTKAAGSLLVHGAASVRWVDLPGRTEHAGADDVLAERGKSYLLEQVRAAKEWRAV